MLVYCEGTSSRYDNRTWLEDVKNIVELNGKPITICDNQPVPVFKQGDSVVVCFPLKGKPMLYRGSVNFGDDQIDKSSIADLDPSGGGQVTDKHVAEDRISEGSPSTSTIQSAKNIVVSEGALSSEQKKYSPVKSACRKRPRSEEGNKARKRSRKIDEQVVIL